MIDYLILWIGSAAVLRLLLPAFVGDLVAVPDPERGMKVFGALMNFTLFGVVAWWLYYAVMESCPTQATVGKLALRIRVSNSRGGRVSFGQATGRTFAKLVSVLTLGIGFLMVAFTPRKQGLHDRLADCLVVRTS